MSRVQAAFESMRSAGKKGIMPFLCGGHPRPGTLPDLIDACVQGGARILEIGIPFSDPIADGPVIAAAMHDALKTGVTPASIFQDVARYRAGPDVRDAIAREMLGGSARDSVALIAMVSISIVTRAGGPQGFTLAAKRAGLDGLIVPDLPLEESAQLRGAAADAGMSLSLLVSPTTSAKRVEEIAKASTGFVYLLARAGITGERAEVPDLQPVVARLRALTPLPIAVGFGISTAEQVRSVVRQADAAIVGSALVRRVDEAFKNRQDPAQAARAMVASLAAGLT